ncbi:hypothetical protein ACTHS6_10940, partial [Neisseria sp. P0016.S006]
LGVETTSISPPSASTTKHKNPTTPTQPTPNTKTPKHPNTPKTNTTKNQPQKNNTHTHTTHTTNHHNTTPPPKHNNHPRTNTPQPTANTQYLSITNPNHPANKNLIRAATAGQCQHSQYDEGQMFGHYHPLRIRLKRDKHHKADKPGRTDPTTKKHQP